MSRHGEPRGRHRRPTRISLDRQFLLAMSTGAVLAATGLHLSPASPAQSVAQPVAQGAIVEVVQPPASTVAPPPPHPVMMAKRMEPRRALTVVGRQGLQPNTVRGLDFIDRNFPQITLVGGVRPDRLPWHPSGHALDVMVPSLAVGDEVFRVLDSHRQELNINYMLWRVPDHFNHVHVNFR